MALLKDGTRIYGTLYANTEVVIGSMNVASQINASFLQANSANILAQAAFNTANSATANTIYTQGVDATQNTRITSADDLARSSFIHANAAFDQANVGATFVNTGGTITGNVTVTKDLSVTGNLYILGNTTSINTSSFAVQDSLITLGLGNYTTDLLDIGFAGHYNDGTNAHAGFVRDSVDKEFYVFQGYTPELSAGNNIDINDPSFSKANLNAGVFKGNLVGSSVTVNGLSLYNFVTSSYDKANTADVKAQAAFDKANTGVSSSIDQYARDTANTNATNITIIQGVNTTQNTNITSVNTFAGGAYDKANTADIKAQAAFDAANTGGGGGGTLDQYARDTANTASANTIYTQGVDATQNASISFLNVYTQAAFDKANTGGGGGSGADQFARDTANSKTYTFYQNTAPATSNAHDLWVNSNTGIVYENFGNTTNPIWAEFGPSQLSNNDTLIYNTLDKLSNLSSTLVLNTNGSVTFPDSTVQTTAYTGFGIDNLARSVANTSNTLSQSGFDKANSANVLAQAAFNKANNALANTTGTFGGDLTVVGSVSVSNSVVTNTLTVNSTSTFRDVVLNGGTNLGALLESVYIVSGAAPTTTPIYVLDSAINYYNANCTQNITVNITANNTTTLNDVIPIGKSITTVLILPQGSTGYTPTDIQVDSVSITPSWSSGITTANVVGNINSTDIYTFTLFKTADATFKVYATQSKYSNIG